jgi:hypothetical protein
MLTLAKPKITNVSSFVWSKLKGDAAFWAVVLVSVLLTFYFGFLPLMIVAAYVAVVHILALRSFWTEIAEVNGWTYKGRLSGAPLPAIMFRQGNKQSFSSVLEGVLGGSPFTSFSYTFATGEGKSEVTHPYHVFSFPFGGTFPHVYLNNKHNSYGLSVGERVPLPSEFEKQFLLSTPKEYEIEALEIFTPDILSKVLDGKFIHDMELVNQHLFIFINKSISDFETFEQEMKKAMELRNILADRLDKFTFEKIGDRSSLL